MNILGDVYPHESFKHFTAEKANRSFSHGIYKTKSAEKELYLRVNTCQNLPIKVNNENQSDLEKSPSSHER